MGNIGISKFDIEEYLELKVIKKSSINKRVFSYKAIEDEERLAAYMADYIAQHKSNIDIGMAGENFVLEYERECVRKYNLPEDKEVVWISKDVGDGLGYDILSYDSQGNEIFIEVKTTPGDEKSSFYITANELLKSEQEKERYFLYRVFNFDEKKKQGELSVRRGSLKDLCIMPKVYKVKVE